jgi:hypothetical protein
MQYQPGSPHNVAIYQVWLQYLIPNFVYRLKTRMLTNRPTSSLLYTLTPKIRSWGYKNQFAEKDMELKNVGDGYIIGGEI